MIARILPVVVLALAGLLAASARADADLAGVPASGRQEFAIFREGEQIGMQLSEFVNSGNQLTVRTRVDIAVEVLIFTAFRFELDSEERWVDGQLVALRTRANDDGTKKSVDARRDDGNAPGLLRVSYNGKASALPAGVLPTSLWNPATVEQSELVDVLNGKRRAVTVTPRGTETVQIAGRLVAARHYIMRGGIDRELWYGLDGQLLKVLFPAGDGSQVTVLRKSL